MTTRLLTAVFLIVLVGAAPVGVNQAVAAAAPVPVADEVILKFKPGTSDGARDGVLATLAARQVVALGRTGAILVRLGGPTAAETVAHFTGSPSLAYIEPNFRYTAQLVPNEPWFDQQWSLLNTGQTGGTPGADIHATSAWDLATGLPSVTLAIIDSGIDFAHPDLAGNLYVNPGEVAGNGIDDDGNGYVDDVCGWDFVNEDNDPADDNGHGTLMAGIAGAVANNGIGIAGVAWRVSLLPLKFLNATGQGTTADAVRALDYAVTMGVGITNNAWGGGDFSQALLDAITAAEQAGVAFVVSAGASGVNLDVTPVYPASYDVANVIAVAATDADDQLASFSNYGAATVDIAAPGVAILTTQRGSSFTTLSGTSAATAHVAGALALVQTRFPLASGLDAGLHVVNNAEKVAALTGFVRMGRLDAYAPLATPPSAAPGGGEAEPQSGSLQLWWKPSRDGAVRLGLDLPRSDRVRLTVYDVRGRRVRDLDVGDLPGGRHELAWDTRSETGVRAASGVYFVRLQTDAGSASTRVVIER